ncbi:TPA: HAD hydrolase family protein, partial [Campylobacter coli]
MKTLIIDLDGTLTIDEENVDYVDKRPNTALIQTLKKYKKQGFKINIFTSRNMRTF